MGTHGHLSQGELLRPNPMEVEAFDALRARLSGMNHCAATVPAREGSAGAPADMSLLGALSLQYVHGCLVGAGPAVRVAACGLSDGRPMLAVLEAREGGGVSVAVHAEDAIGGNILLDELVKGLKDGA